MNTRTYMAASALLLAALGCRDDSESPAEPTSPQVSTAAASPLVFRQVSTGGGGGSAGHTCGVTTDDRAYCWGDIIIAGPDTCTYEQACSKWPMEVQVGLHFRSLTVGAGGTYVCGIGTDARAYCWGWGDFGDLGDGTRTGSDTAVAVAGGLRFRQLDAGLHHACGVTTEYRVYCWGDNAEGQLGIGTNSGPENCWPWTNACSAQPVLVAGRRYFKQVSTGNLHTCAVTTDNLAYCWGSNRLGQIGDSSTAIIRRRPTLVSGGRHFRQLDAGALHTCALTGGDRAFCWGNGRDGQLGNGKAYLSFWPRRVAGGLLFKRVTAGSGHSCGWTATNQAYCWGANNSGQLGDGTTDGRLQPVAVGGGLYFSQVSAGGSNTCARTSTGFAYCWGWNYSGQIGDGTIEDRLLPTPVAGPI